MVFPTLHDLRDRFTALLWLCVASFLLTGCTARQSRRQLAEQLATGAEAPFSREQVPEQSYRIAFGDVVEIVVPGMPECSGVFPITVEGRVEIKALGNPRVDGDSLRALSRRIGDLCDLRPGEVRCRVVEYRSRFVYVYGPVNGPERAVAYRGPENVVSLLRRIGGVQPGAKLDEVHVIRSNMVSGKPPELFDVDLEAILIRGEPESTVVLQPFDTIYIGELRRARLGKALPHWMRPAYRGFCGVFPNACPHDWRQQIRDE